MPVKRIIFMRPGETDWNKMKRWQGHVAIPLNPHGRAQVQRLAQFVKILGLDAMYSSDLQRAKETGEIIAAETGTHCILDTRLRERAMGAWQGLTPDEITSWYPEEYQRLQRDRDGYQIPGGESRRQVKQRMRAAFDDVVARGGEYIGIISHATAIRALLADLIPNADSYNLSFRNMSVTTIAQQDDGIWQITQLDDVTHLEGMSATSFPEVGDHKKEPSA